MGEGPSPSHAALAWQTTAKKSCKFRSFFTAPKGAGALESPQEAPISAAWCNEGRLLKGYFPEETT